MRLKKKNLENFYKKNQKKDYIKKINENYKKNNEKKLY